MRKSLSILALACLFVPAEVVAWNKPGHRTVAAVAYLNLSASTRARVDALLHEHPDFSVLSKGLSKDDVNFGLFVFMRAAEWPDVIREDGRFFDETDPKSKPTAQLPGFPDMMRHRPWHFISQGFSTDGTPTKSSPDPGAFTQIIALESSLGKPGVLAATQAYNLSWLLHLVGDIHQPLHCISRFSSRHPKGDSGGNGFKLEDEGDLHKLWDNVLTAEGTQKTLVTLAKDLMDKVKRDSGDVSVAKEVAVSVQRWVDESVALTKYVVYTVGEEKSTPIVVPKSYQTLAGKIARHRAVMAGYRLAELLNQALP